MLWLWHRLAATALIRPLAWEPPYTAGMALKRERERERERKKVKDHIPPHPRMRDVYIWSTDYKT